MTQITPALCRAGRGLLGWNQNQLAAAAKVGLSTLRSFETGKRALMHNNLVAIRAAFEASGVEFTSENGSSGLRLKLGENGRSHDQTTPTLSEK